MRETRIEIERGRKNKSTRPTVNWEKSPEREERHDENTVRKRRSRKHTAIKMPDVQHSPPASRMRSRDAPNEEAVRRDPDAAAAEGTSHDGERFEDSVSEPEKEPPRTEMRGNRALVRQIVALTRELEELRAGIREARRDEDYAQREHVFPSDDERETVRAEGPNAERDHGAAVTDLMPVQIRLPRGGWMKNPFDEISYRGKSGRQNPIRFFQRFEKLATYERVPEEEQAFYFGRCLKGPASQWYELLDEDDIHTVKRLFREQF